MLKQLENGIIVSCQPVAGGPMDRPDIIAAYARAALDGGAVGLRIEGIANLRAVRAAIDAPVIGIVKRDLPASDVRITPLLEDIGALADAGADIIAVDATTRPRPVALPDLIAAIKAASRIAMADCATAADAQTAVVAGAEILGTTMSGYTGGTVPVEPDYDLLADLPAFGRFVIAEGRYQKPGQAARALALGANAVVVGSAVTRPEHITSWFVEALRAGEQPNERYG